MIFDPCFCRPKTINVFDFSSNETVSFHIFSDCIVSNSTSYGVQMVLEYVLSRLVRIHSWGHMLYGPQVPFWTIFVFFSFLSHRVGHNIKEVYTAMLRQRCTGFLIELCLYILNYILATHLSDPHPIHCTYILTGQLHLSFH